MRARSSIAGIVLGVLACSPSFGFELLDRMLGTDLDGSQPRVVHQASCPTGTCQDYAPSCGAEPGRSLFRAVSASEPGSCEPATCDPACEPIACGPVVGEPIGCGPIACEPIVCDPSVTCRPRPVRDMFLRLRAMFACDVCCTSPCCCEPACGPVCGPVCEPCGPVCGPACETGWGLGCGSVCGPMSDPCRPRPLLGMLNNLFCSMKVGPVWCEPAYCEPVVFEPAGCECGGGCNSGPDQDLRPEPDEGNTTPAPEPPLAPEADPTVRWDEPSQDVRSTGYHKFGW